MDDFSRELCRLAVTHVVKELKEEGVRLPDHEVLELTHARLERWAQRLVKILEQNEPR
jgi:hypothetical protein